jgi:citrate synthase
MTVLHDRLTALLPAWRAEIAGLLRGHGGERLDSVTAAQVLGGMRGMRALVCDTSEVDPQAGLSIRGIPILKLAQRLPEEVFWLMLTGGLPAPDELAALQAELAARPPLPGYVAGLLAALPPEAHPVTLYGAALLALQRESRFAQAYGHLPQAELWRPALDDALNLLAWAPQAAALVYKRGHWLGAEPPPLLGRDWAERTSYLLDHLHRPLLVELLRLYFVVHADHESGNASAFACHTVGSALADPFRAVASSLCALAGPIHGMAAQTCLEFVESLLPASRSYAPDEYVEQACRRRLAAHQVIPGFGHAVLRGDDPRFQALYVFGEGLFRDKDLYLVADSLYRVAPRVLAEHSAAKNVHPNVDGISGVLLQCAGIAQPRFFTVLFSLGQMLGLLAQYVLARGLGAPIVRTRSVPLAALRGLAAAAPG